MSGFTVALVLINVRPEKKVIASKDISVILQLNFEKIIKPGGVPASHS